MAQREEIVRTIVSCSDCKKEDLAALTHSKLIQRLIKVTYSLKFKINK